MTSSQTFSNPSRVLQRNESLFEGKSILVAGNIDDNYPLHLQSIAASCCFCFNDYRYYQKLKDKLSTSDVFFTDDYKGQENQKKFDLLLIYIPKAKTEIEYLLANLVPHLNSQADIILVGEKKCGIKSVSELLKPYSDIVNAIDSARHSSVIYAQLNKSVAPFVQQHWIKDYPININGTSLTIRSLPGVFSYGALDKGSELLLNNLPEELSGEGLDFGCGAGVLACYLLKKHTQLKLDLIDVNAYALASAKLTLQINALEANVFASDVFSHVTKEYDLLLSNPPFHAGQKTNYDAAEAFINQSSKFLKKKGRLAIVANKFLRYEPLLELTYNKFTQDAENNKFKVLSCLK